MAGQPERRARRWLKRLALGLVAIILFVPSCGLVYQAVATRLDARRYTAPGKLVDVGGRRMHLFCTGSGSPTVVLEAGLLSFSLQWSWVQPAVARFTRVCSYDRAGYGWSDVATWLPTAGRQSDDLRNLLATAGERGPYVLVGHSYGAFVVRAFAQRHGDSVAGVVLVDPAHPSQYSRDPKRCDPACLPAALRDDFMRICRLAPLLARFGVLRAMRSDAIGLHSLVKPFPAERQPAMFATLSATRHWTTGAAEVDHFEESADDARALNTLGDKPLALVVADSTWVKQKSLRGGHDYKLPAGIDPAALDQTILLLNRDQAKLSTDSLWVVVPGATHTSLATSGQDAAKVSDVIQRIVEKVRLRMAYSR